MKVLVCGGRYFQDVSLLWRHLDQLHAKSPITCVIEGGSDAVAGEYYGADYWARMWAQARGINSVTCWADWDQFGRWAGPKRNKEMLERYGPGLGAGVRRRQRHRRHGQASASRGRRCPFGIEGKGLVMLEYVHLDLRAAPTTTSHGYASPKGEHGAQY